MEILSKHYVRYANMASILSPAMSDLDLLGAMITHYKPRIQNCLISANLKSTQEALAFLTKLQSWKIRGSNTGQHGEISNTKTKTAEHCNTSLFTARGITDLMTVVRYTMSGALTGTGTLGAPINKKSMNKRGTKELSWQSRET
jgi:hypothetical protein